MRKFKTGIVHNIRLMFHHTHCESDCGVVGCECDNEVVSSSTDEST